MSLACHKIFIAHCLHLWFYATSDKSYDVLSQLPEKLNQLALQTPK